MMKVSRKIHLKLLTVLYLCNYGQGQKTSTFSFSFFSFVD